MTNLGNKRLYLYLENFPTNSAGWSLSTSGKGLGFFSNLLQIYENVKIIGYSASSWDTGLFNIPNLYSSIILSTRISIPTIAIKPSPTINATPTIMPSSRAALTVCSPEIG